MKKTDNAKEKVVAKEAVKWPRVYRADELRNMARIYLGSTKGLMLNQGADAIERLKAIKEAFGAFCADFESHIIECSDTTASGKERLKNYKEWQNLKKAVEA